MLLYRDVYDSTQAEAAKNKRLIFSTAVNDSGIITIQYLEDHEIKQEQDYCKVKDSFLAHHVVFRWEPFKKYQCCFNFNGDRVILVDPINCNTITFSKNTPDKHFVFLHTSSDYDHGEGDYLYLIYREQIDKVDSNLQVVQSFPVSTLVDKGARPNELVYLYQDTLWGNCVATQSSGAYLNVNIDKHTGLFSWNPRDTIFIGKVNDSTRYWWNPSKQEIIKRAANEVRVFKCTLPKVRKMVPYNEKFSFLVTEGIYLFNNTTGELTQYYYASAKDFVIVNSHFHSITSGDIRRYGMPPTTPEDEPIVRERYNDIFFDTATEHIVTYNESNIFIYRDTGHYSLSVGKDVLRLLGINVVQKMVADQKHRNIFIKDYDRLLVYNLSNSAPKRLLSNFNLAGAKIALWGDVLLTAGKFGLAFIKITGPGKFEQAAVYHNIKNNSYTDVKNLEVINDSAILTTDRGTYVIPVLHPFFHANTSFPYKLLLKKGKDLSVIGAGDTITMGHDHEPLLFDIVRPMGNGRIRYSYRIRGTDTTWNKLFSNELNLPDLDPGKYYTLLLQVQDDVWVSDPVRLKIYLTPKWWQTPTGKRVMWGIAILLAALIIFFTVQVTRRITARNIRKRSELLELKLKAVYAQMNPHFIYNTLGTALLLINNNNMKDAYTHVSKFSRLLRAYVRSSRNKYITINEEIENLKNYIELQQARFKHKFSYGIATDSHVQSTNPRIPSLLIQPFVENAIHHGLLNKNDRGHLQVSFKKNAADQRLVCIIEDDGIGRKAAMSINEDKSIKESYGNELIKDLVNIFRKYEHMQIEVNYTDKEYPATGTIVEIIINTPQHE